MEDLWLMHAKRLQAIASTGLYYAKDEFDRERYREVGEIANGMLAALGDVPIERISSLVSEFAKGYATPKVDVRGALIENGKILLVQERSDGRWSLPGGFADVGHSASENIRREILEEAGISVSVHNLYAIRHKAKGPYEPDARTSISCSSSAKERARLNHTLARNRLPSPFFRALIYRNCPWEGSPKATLRPHSLFTKVLPGQCFLTEPAVTMEPANRFEDGDQVGGIKHNCAKLSKTLWGYRQTPCLQQVVRGVDAQA